MERVVAHGSVRTASVGKRYADRVDDPDKIRFFDALIFGLFVFDRMAFAPGFPVGVAVASLIILIGVFRKPRLKVDGFPKWAILYTFMLAYLAMLSYLMGQVGWQQRLLRFVILAGLLWVVATGRYHFKSIVAGLVVSMTLNVLAFYLGLTSNYYPPFLTGFFGDKNVAGMWYAVIGVLGLLLWRKKKHIILWVLASGVVLFLAGSRTSMAGFAVATVWILMRNKFGVVGRIGLVAALAGALNFVEDEYARIGVFSDRDGTDWFRAELDIATAKKVAETPWYGRGLTEGWVWYSPTRKMWVHDSFAGLYLEGGIIMAAIVLLIFVIVGFGLLRSGKVNRDLLIVEASLLVVLVCAWKLGEVFFTTVAFMALAGAISYRYGRPLRVAKRKNVVEVERKKKPLPNDLHSSEQQLEDDLPPIRW